MEAFILREQPPKEATFTLEIGIEMAMPNCLLSPPSPGQHLPTVPMGVGVRVGGMAPCPGNPHQVSLRGQDSSLVFCKRLHLLIKFTFCILLVPLVPCDFPWPLLLLP